eukprot:scaffold610_cov352-Pavlova_lutheri.AAC.8
MLSVCGSDEEPTCAALAWVILMLIPCCVRPIHMFAGYDSLCACEIQMTSKSGTCWTWVMHLADDSWNGFHPQRRFCHIETYAIGS